MKTLRKKAAAPRLVGGEHLISQALAEFEAESRVACRALRVRMAVMTFGVGSLLPNDLPGDAPEVERPETFLSNTLH
ncbi:hypothetical protein H0H12_10685 [Pseudomonas putida]|uniref:Uncharacterized protein n=1 Tax=Pseudomonas putida TaxID=303 RepID=A0A7D5W097_PSEPU|nr:MULTISPECIES: hypothetical protein [Pseudomonas]PWY45577.1 hypothetical protein DK184_13230 [Pseudomonas sp. RW405]QLJ16351.1 hypothetical protein H0H12_10685 [Pseudomonas putida]